MVRYWGVLTATCGGTGFLGAEMEDTRAMQNFDPATLLYVLQFLEPVLNFVSSFAGIFLQLLFLGLDFGSFFLGFI